MRMRDGMHAIDLGVIVTLIRAILRAFLECVELILDIEGRAAAKLEKRFKNVLACRMGREGQRYMQHMQYMHLYEKYATNAFVCNICIFMYDMQVQGDTRLFGPCDPLLGRNIQTPSVHGQASSKSKGHGHASCPPHLAVPLARTPH